MGLKIDDPKTSALINVDAENAFCRPDSLSTRPTPYSWHVGQAATRLVPLLSWRREAGLPAISTIWGDSASRKSRLVGTFAEMAPDPISAVPIPVDVPFGEARLPGPLSSCKAERPVVADLAADHIAVLGLVHLHDCHVIPVVR